MVSRWSESDRKSSQVCSNLIIIIMADVINAVVWMVFSLLIFKSSLFSNPLAIVPRAPIRVSIAVTFVFYGVFCSLARSRYSALLLVSFHFTLWPSETANFTFHLVLFFCWRLKVLVVRARLGDFFVSQNPRELCTSHSPGRIPGCAYIICLYGQISVSCTIPSR